jgi:hypothetical protein
LRARRERGDPRVKRIVCCIAAVCALLLTAPAAFASSTRSRIVKLAARQIGYREPGNFCTKYGPCELWCSLFVTWVWRHEGVPVPSLAFTGYMYDWAQRNTAVIAPSGVPQPGDAVLFGTGPQTVATSVHTGIVQAVYPGYLVTIEGDVLHGVRRFVVPVGDPQGIGEPGPIYGYAAPVAPTGSAARASAAFERFPRLSRRMIGRQATMASGSALLRTIASLRAFQHMPYRMPHARINWTGVSAQGLVEVQVTTRGSLRTARGAWRRFLRRFADAGHAYQVTFKAAGSPSAGTPVSVAPPSISGIAFEGQTVTENNGTWTNNPTSHTYQWEDCDVFGQSCTPIYGATGQSYTLTARDVGHTIRVQETASNASGAGQPATSEQSAAVVGLPLGL